MTTTNEPVFVPISFDKYKGDKIKCLEAQLLLKKTLFLVKDIEELKKIKDSYRKILSKTIVDLHKDVNKFKQIFPKYSNSSLGITHKQQTTIVTPVTPKDYDNSRFDEELEEIQRKLRVLSE